jgi:acyl carrier protein
MERTEILGKLQGVFKNILKNSSLDLTESLSAHDVDGWDSLTHMLIISEVEGSFKIKFKLKDLNKMKNIGDMIDIIASKLSV